MSTDQSSDLAPFDGLKAKQSITWGLGTYERMPDGYAPLLDHLIRVLDPAPSASFLDIGTGTGALASRAARAGAHVTGVDLAPAMIDTARRLAAEEGLSIEYQVADAEALPFPDASFDVVGSSIGTIFAPDHQAVAAELSRVCKPGGRLGLGCWSAKSGVIDLFAILRPFQPPPVPGAGSPFAWGDRTYVEDVLGNDFNLHFEDGDAPQRAATSEDVWELFYSSYGPVRALADSLEPARRSDLRETFLAYYDGFQGREGIRQPRPYVIVAGTRH